MAQKLPLASRKNGQIFQTLLQKLFLILLQLDGHDIRCSMRTVHVYRLQWLISKSLAEQFIAAFFEARQMAIYRKTPFQSHRLLCERNITFCILSNSNIVTVLHHHRRGNTSSACESTWKFLCFGKFAPRACTQLNRTNFFWFSKHGVPIRRGVFCFFSRLNLRGGKNRTQICVSASNLLRCQQDEST